MILWDIGGMWLFTTLGFCVVDYGYLLRKLCVQKDLLAQIT